MAKTTAFNVRINGEVKKQADDILNYLGMTTSEAINVFLRQVIINRGLPFAVVAPSFADSAKLELVSDKILEKHMSAFEELAK